MLQVCVSRRLGALRLDVEFDVGASEILAVHGPSGSGKTTLVNVLAGLERPDRGRIVIGERVLFDSERGIDVKPETRRVGYVFQDSRLFPHMSVASNLRYGRHRDGAKIDFDHVVDLLDLRALLRRRPRFLSGGEKQRVAIGRALLSGPQILLLDEPLASIDPQRKAEILPFIRRLRDVFRLPIIYVTHAPDEIARIADRTIRIEDGRLSRADRAVDMSVPMIPQVGVRLIAVIRGEDAETGLTMLESPLGPLFVARQSEPVGTMVQVAVNAGRVEPIAPDDAADITVLPVRSAGGSRSH